MRGGDRVTRRLRSLDSTTRCRLAAVAVALLAALTVYLVATRVFPYHSTNHDEAVYLQQAAMLLDGRLFLRPPVVDAFRPWFFVRRGDLLYPKYAPVPAAMFAVGRLLGDAHLALAGVAAAVVALTYVVVSEAFDRWRGLLAAGFVLASPLFLVDGALFLPYVPTTCWTLAFAAAYLRGDRTGRRRQFALAGVAVGVAFFARPYTTVLFAAPFVAHALWSLRPRAGETGAFGLPRDELARRGTVAAFGLLGVGVALAYNWRVTGSPWLFPYEAFAPLDGLGFGHRRILGHDVQYTPSLALRANLKVLVALFSEWVAAGWVGSLAALCGVVVFGRNAIRGGDETAGPTADPTARRATLAGLFVAVPLGNLFFWGNFNVLGALDVAGDGLIALYGPYYHFDLLVPTAAFAAHGVVTAATWLRGRLDASSRPAVAENARVLVAVALLVTGGAVAPVTADAIREPIADSREVTAQLAAAYDPVESASLDGALVFLPTPYGDWLNHPFQALRNDPDYDDGPVYALRERQFAVVDAFPDRPMYRYVYRGEWSPHGGPPVDARLQRVEAVSGERVVLDSTVDVPADAASVTVRVAGDDGSAYFVADERALERGTLSLTVTVADGEATVSGDVTPTGSRRVSVGDRTDLVVTAFVDYGTGGFDYRVVLPTATEDGTTRALTPYVEVCRRAYRCGGEAAYLPNETADGVFVDSELRAS